MSCCSTHPRADLKNVLAVNVTSCISSVEMSVSSYSTVVASLAVRPWKAEQMRLI